MRRHVIIALAVPVVLALVGCQTPYQKRGFRGGYQNSWIDRNTMRVEFEGNESTPRQKVEAGLLFRCAELTIKAGYDYFVITEAETEARHSTHVVEALQSSDRVGERATVYGRSSQSQPYAWTVWSTSYYSNAVIQMYQGDAPDELRAFDAGDVIAQLQSVVR